MIADHIAKNLDPYEMTTQMWPVLDPEEGRIVVFFPRQGALKTFNPIGMGGTAFATVSLNNESKIEMMDRTFIFYDVPAGEHTLSVRKKEKVSLQVTPGNTQFVKLDFVSLINKGTPAHEVDGTDPDLAGTVHNFRVPIPANVILKITWDDIKEMKKQMATMKSSQVREFMRSKKREISRRAGKG